MNLWVLTTNLKREKKKYKTSKKKYIVKYIINPPKHWCGLHKFKSRKKKIQNHKNIVISLSLYQPLNCLDFEKFLEPQK